MLRKKSFYVITLLVGVALLGAALVLRMFPEVPKSVGGVCIGIGAGLFGMSVSNLYMKHLEKTDPKIVKKNEIEYTDERNTMIRNVAKAKAGDIIQWFIMGIAYLTILIGTSLWITLVVVGVFLLRYLLEIYFTSKYQHEM
jgi:ABC-type bacteriocin/lantibiotic exporter with double-glycine peptidase domain